MGIDGTSAYNDIATACITFTVFYLTQIWASDKSNSGLLAPVGMVAGFGYATKYTAFLAVPYALCVVAWVSIRGDAPVVKPLLVVAASSALLDRAMDDQERDCGSAIPCRHFSTRFFRIRTSTFPSRSSGPANCGITMG